MEYIGGGWHLGTRLSGILSENRGLGEFGLGLLEGCWGCWGVGSWGGFWRVWGWGVGGSGVGPLYLTAQGMSRKKLTSDKKNIILEKQMELPTGIEPAFPGWKAWRFTD